MSDINERARENGNREGGCLTKREWFAGMAMQGLLANPDMTNNFSPAYDAEPMAADARRMADALLLELARTEGGGE